MMIIRGRFLTNLKLTKKIEDLDYVLEGIKKEAFAPHVSFARDYSLSAVSNIDSLGEVRRNEGPRNFGTGMTINSSREIEVRAPSDDSILWISSSVFLPNGWLVLCDRQNNCLKVFDETFAENIRQKLPGQPRYYCLINQNDVLVSLPDEKQILWFDSVPFLMTKQSFKFDAVCDGVATLNEYIFCNMLLKTRTR